MTKNIADQIQTKDQLMTYIADLVGDDAVVQFYCDSAALKSSRATAADLDQENSKSAVYYADYSAELVTLMVGATLRFCPYQGK